MIGVTKINPQRLTSASTINSVAAEWEWWEPPADWLPFDYLRDTSLHGLRYIYQPGRHLSERIFWFISFMIGLTMACYLIVGVWQNYRDKPIIVAFEPFETNVESIPFPAVTICNMNKILRSRAEKLISKFDGAESLSDLKRKDHEDLFQLTHICSVSAGFSKGYNFSLGQEAVPTEFKNVKLEKVEGADGKDGDNMKGQSKIQEFLQDYSQPCPNMLPLCIWRDNRTDCEELFNPIETEFGKCCTFNMVSQTLLHRFRIDKRDKQEEIDDWKKWNIEDDGLLILDEPELEEDNNATKRIFPRRQRRAGKSFGLSILLDPNLSEYYCTTSDSIGFRLSTHLSIDTPDVSDFGIGISPNQEIFVNIQPQITTAEPAIRGFELKKRRCYFPNEYPLEYYEYYTTANCVDECIANETRDKCKCVRYYMPRGKLDNLCGPEKYHCAEEVKKTYIRAGLKNKCGHCLRTCTEIKYFVESSSTPLLFNETNWQFPDESFAPWRTNNVSIVHIYIGQPSTYARVRKQLYGWNDLIANTGGIMGLCLGFSGLSLIEVIYYFTLRACWRRQRSLQKIGTNMLTTVMDAWSKPKPKEFGFNYNKPMGDSKTYQRNLKNEPQDLDPIYKNIETPPVRPMYQEISRYYKNQPGKKGASQTQMESQYWNEY